MKPRSQQGSVLIGVLITLGVAAFAYVLTSTTFFENISKQKTKTQLDVLSKSLTSAIFNYTAYAIKERWCMDQNWGRDIKCGASTAGDMKGFISHPRNLERFLWSKVTLNDMSLRYEKIYGEPPAGAINLNKLEQSISISSLESLGMSHPLNLVMDDNIKKCLSSVSITIEKPLASFYKPQGDEVYILITVKGHLSLNPLNRCSLIKNNPVLKGLVVVYPKTLNQYALIKADDFNISDYGSSNKGLEFYGPVYVQKNVNLPSSGKYGVSFKDKVRIGEGVLKVNGKSFVPATPGGPNDQYLSQISTMNGFMNGISLEAEIDEGLPRLFGGSYQYPSNVNMAMCTNRKALKDNLSLTKNSRLWMKGSNGKYTFALSEQNEFREYIRHGANSKGQYIYNNYSQGYENSSQAIKNKFVAEVKEQNETQKPIMEVIVSVDGKNYSTLYLGRSSEAKVTFANTEFFKEQRDHLDTSDTTYLDINTVDFTGMSIDSSLRTEYQTFYNRCNSLKSNDVSLAECGKVIKDYNSKTTDCSVLVIDEPSSGSGNGSGSGPSSGNGWGGNNSSSNNNGSGWSGGKSELEKAREKCAEALVDVSKAKNNYFTVQNKLISNLKDFTNNPPALVLKTTEVLSNKQDVAVTFVNKNSFKYPFVTSIENIKLKFNVYDFAIEDSNNTVVGLRGDKKSRLPGPNESGTDGENALNFDIVREYGEVKKIETKKNDGTNFEYAYSYNWGVLKSENKSMNDPEPPGNTPFFSDIRHPENGLTVAEAKELDVACEVDTNAIPPPSWDVSFTEHTQFSWLYNVTNPGITITDPSQVQPLPSYTFTNLDMEVGNYQGVPTRSIVKECIVPNTVDLVFGFYVCETLRIQSRSRPLNLVGTFIIKNLPIEGGALASGVNFYSIWSSGGIQLLRDHRHLRREKSKTEECVFDKPGWFSGLDEDTQADYISCSPAKFLYQGANNFNWTTIDPEIGITGTNTQVTTQSKVFNRYRRYGANVIWIRTGVE